MKHLLLSFLLFSSIISFSQDNTDAYQKHIKNADSLYKSQQYGESVKEYELAFSNLGGKAYPNDRYNAACSYSLAKEVDSSFKHLFRLTDNSNYSNYNHIMIDIDLNNLKSDRRWNEFVEKVKANKAENEKDYKHELVTILDEVYQSDQEIRMGYMDSIAKYGQGSKELQAYWDKMSAIDSINELKVCKIIDKNGWLGKDKIGPNGNMTLFLVIQHSNLSTQERYLPIMREAVKNKRAEGNHLALLEDRVALGQGKKQIYGSQIGTMPETQEQVVQPLIDPENVDKRRAEVGLGPLAVYAQRFGIKWNLEEYLKRLPELEKAFQIK